MLFDILRSIFEVSKTLRAVRCAQLAYEVLGVRIEVAGEVYVAHQNFLVDIKGVFVVKGRVSAKNKWWEYGSDHQD